MLGTQLNTFQRFFFYGLHGFFDEICFTAIHDLLFNRFDGGLKGHSSIWAFWIYGSCSIFVEWLYKSYLNGNFRTLTRGLIYMCVAYTWEFISGLILSASHACPWDYSEKKYNVMGLITLEYAPVWFAAGLYQEYLYEFLDRLYLKPTVSCDDEEHRPRKVE